MARQVAHDIKNPLTPIQLSAEHARRINIDRGASALAGARRLRGRDPVAGQAAPPDLERVLELRVVANRAARNRPTSARCSRRWSSRTGRVSRRASRSTVEAEPGLPQAFIDRTLFARALTNVIENALHAMPGARLARRCGRSRRRPMRRWRPHVIVEVRDTGIGMDAEALGRIFEPYFSTKATGTGLGLTIARRNVELIGGTIEVRSERGTGTTVTMRLPVVA